MVAKRTRSNNNNNNNNSNSNSNSNKTNSNQFRNNPLMDDSSNGSCFDRPFAANATKNFLDVLEPSEELVIFTDTNEEDNAASCYTACSSSTCSSGLPRGLDFGVEAKKRKAAAAVAAGKERQQQQQQQQQEAKHQATTMTSVPENDDWSQSNNPFLVLEAEEEVCEVVEEEFDTDEPDAIMSPLAMATIVAAMGDPDASAIIHDGSSGSGREEMIRAHHHRGAATTGSTTLQEEEWHVISLL